MILWTNTEMTAFEEQQKIADFLSAYEGYWLCKEWRDLKKSLLQQMFV